MATYAIVADNGGSDLRYKDIVGVVYTFPSRYVDILQEGTKFVYMRCGVGSMRVPEPDRERLLDEAHYFGIAEIGPVIHVGGELYEAKILNYHHFTQGVPFRLASGDHFENAPGYFWRNGVRATIKEVYDEIVKASLGVIPASSPSTIPAYVPPPPTAKTTTLKTSKPRAPKSSVKMVTTLSLCIASRSFANDRFQVVTAKTGYWLYSIPEDKYFQLAPLGGNSYRVGDIKIGPKLLSKDPIVKSDTEFSISHVDETDRYTVGSLAITDDTVTFRGTGSNSQPVVITL